MKFKEIVKINTNLLKLKDMKKNFDFNICSKLFTNLEVTNKIIAEQKEKLNELSKPLMSNDAYNVITEENIDKFEGIKKHIDEEEFNTKDIGLVFITEHDFNFMDQIDLESIELMKPLLSIG
jgi:hypothetical protein